MTPCSKTTGNRPPIIAKGRERIEGEVWGPKSHHLFLEPFPLCLFMNQTLHVQTSAVVSPSCRHTRRPPPEWATAPYRRGAATCHLSPWLPSTDPLGPGPANHVASTARTEGTARTHPALACPSCVQKPEGLSSWRRTQEKVDPFGKIHRLGTWVACATASTGLFKELAGTQGRVHQVLPALVPLMTATRNASYL